MTRLTLAALIVLMPTLAAAWETPSYDGGKSASFTATSSDKDDSDRQEADTRVSDRLASSGDDGTQIVPTEELFGAYHFDARPR